MALKMYILIRDDVDLGHAMLAAAHGTLACYLDFNDEVMQEYVKTSFRKVICRVTPAEFEKAKTYTEYKHRVMVESGLGGAETAVVFAPREEWSNFFKSLKLYREAPCQSTELTK